MSRQARKHIEFAPGVIERFLAIPGLSRNQRQRVFQEIKEAISQVADGELQGYPVPFRMLFEPEMRRIDVGRFAVKYRETVKKIEILDIFVSQ